MDHLKKILIKSLAKLIPDIILKITDKHMTDEDEEALMKKYENKDYVTPGTLKKGVDLHK